MYRNRLETEQNFYVGRREDVPNPAREGYQGTVTVVGVDSALSFGALARSTAVTA